MAKVSEYRKMLKKADEAKREADQYRPPRFSGKGIEAEVVIEGTADHPAGLRIEMENRECLGPKIEHRKKGPPKDGVTAITSEPLDNVQITIPSNEVGNFAKLVNWFHETFMEKDA